VALGGRGDERLRGVDAAHGVRAEAPDELRRQRARPAADVEHAQPRRDAGEPGEERRERARVPPHEAVVRVGRREHTRNLDAPISYRRETDTEPRTPYPPDPGDDPPSAVELADLVDATVENRDWANRRAPGVVLRRVELRLCRLTGAELGESALTDVTFAGCRLDLAALRFAKLERVVFRDCRMAECDFHEASLSDVSFERCELREARFTGARVERVELAGCDLLGATGVEALRGARMPWNDVLANAPAFAIALGIEIV